MILKRLTLNGFKSFADKTDLEFEPGITCVVGPNGCGKSNVVDAIKWVVGEQSARSLRGRAMLDMIFNGSSTRKTSGLCQVDLHFDECADCLSGEHADKSEVTVSRRLFRSGESEYLINQQPVRLKDVRDLFMDTGIGVGAYSIIEQGRVDILLQANPAERRAIFEEAAGISRFKARKKEATRKLDRAQQNLLRVEDIIEEVERRLRSVKLQAGKARNFQAYSERLRELRSSFSLAEYHRLTQTIARLTEEQSQATDRITETRTRLSGAESRSGQLDAQVIGLDEKITSAESRLHGVRAEMTACRERTEQTRQRMAEQREVLDKAQLRVRVQEEQVGGLNAEIAEEDQLLEKLGADLDAFQSRLEELAGEDQAAASRHAGTQAQLDEEQANIIELMRSTAQVNNELATLEQHRHNLADQNERLARRRAEIQRQLSEWDGERQGHAARLQEVRGQIAAENASLEENRQKCEALDAERSRLSNRLADAKEKRSAMYSRRHLLLDLDRKMEGIEAGVRDILLARNEDESGETFGYVRGLIGDQFETDVEHAAVVEAALGDLDQVLLVSDHKSLMNDSGRLGELHGRMNALCLDLLPAFVRGPDLSALPGFVANVLDLVRFPDALERLSKYLLGNTVLVETLGDALAMSRMAPTTRFISRRGEVLEPDGRVSMGPAGTRAGLVSRKSELRQLDHEFETLDRWIAELGDQLSRASAEVAHLTEEQHRIRADISALQQTRIEIEAAMTNLQASVERLRQEEPLLNSECDSIRAQLADIGLRADSCNRKKGQLEARTIDAHRLADDLGAALEAIGRTRASLSEQITEQRVQGGQLREKRQALSARINSLRVSVGQAELNAEEARSEADACQQRIEEGRHILDQSEQRAAALSGDEQRLTSEAGQLREDRDCARRELTGLGETIKAARAELELAEGRLHDVQMRKQEASVRRDELVDRVRGEMGTELSELYESYEEDDEKDWSAVEEEIRELKLKIDRLGNVNLEAISEQQALEERAGFLNAQHHDLVESRRQLEQLIRRLDEECRERFRTTFEATREHFQELFRRLFGGGKANIILEDPDDILESGIEIIAQPPGKELLNLSLMSGGEKSMTAIALLLAVFRSRPSPFAVLDEVDAALDEANNERFNRIVTEFLSDSQFIIITHSKRTMSISHKLYGVTMQEAGVSTLVSVKFEDESSGGQAVA